MGVCGLTQTVMDAPLSSTLNGLRIFMHTLLARTTLMEESQTVTLTGRTCLA